MVIFISSNFFDGSCTHRAMQGIFEELHWRRWDPQIHENAGKLRVVAFDRG